MVKFFILWVYLIFVKLVIFIFVKVIYVNEFICVLVIFVVFDCFNNLFKYVLNVEFGMFILFWFVFNLVCFVVNIGNVVCDMGIVSIVKYILIFMIFDFIDISYYYFYFVIFV